MDTPTYPEGQECAGNPIEEPDPAQPDPGEPDEFDDEYEPL